MDINNAIAHLEDAAKRVQFWSEHGSHGDGKHQAAIDDLKDARKVLKKAIQDHS